MSSFSKLLAVFIVLIPAGNQAFADPWTGRDKAAHFAAGMGISALSAGLIEGWTGYDRWKTFGISVSAGAGVSLFKEGADLVFNTGDPSYKDLLWGIAGSLVGSLIVIGIETVLTQQGK